LMRVGFGAETQKGLAADSRTGRSLQAARIRRREWRLGPGGIGRAT
jgi:hypothetical protein